MSDFCIGEEHGHHAHRQQVRLGSPWSELRGGRLVRPTAAWLGSATWNMGDLGKELKVMVMFYKNRIVMVMLRWNIFVTEFLNELEQNWESEEAWGLMWGFKRVWAASVATSDWREEEPCGSSLLGTRKWDVLRSRKVPTFQCPGSQVLNWMDRMPQSSSGSLAIIE